MKNKQFLNKTEDRRAYHIIRTIEQGWVDDYMNYHRSKSRRRRPLWYSEITRYEYRMYRTWKYNRKTQWKKE